ncbi:nucleoside phosphatase family-domain-containing protein [Pyronema omphalodes]|nr:nucleoside phosphatase family-domain-containing protein [Pyronema omphalodes]
MGADNHKYGVVLDAGSSGTRLHIYRWDSPSHSLSDADSDDLLRIPEIKTKKKWTKKVKPGVSTFHDKPSSVGPDHLAPLFEHALQSIPKEEISSTPLFLLATAGMRLVEERERKALLDEICTYARRNTDFLLPDCALHIQVIPGETEGLYGWIAANYLLGGFDDKQTHTHSGAKAHHTYGFLDMGGASAQIAFAPNSTEATKHAEDLQLLRLRRLNGEAMEYRVFVTTWLGAGVNEARRRYVDNLIAASGAAGVKELPDPCLPAGVRETLNGTLLPETPSDLHLVGTGKFKECSRQVYPLLDKEKPCLNSPCLLNGQHVPALDFNVNHFVGVSEYWHTTHEIFDADPYDYETFSSRVNEFCSQPWTEITAGISKQKFGKKVDADIAAAACFKAGYLLNVLHEGIGIPKTTLNQTTTQEERDFEGFTAPFRAVDKIDSVELSWTLGRMVLYASSQVPAAAGAPPVGFGSNTPKLGNWQFGGSGAEIAVTPGSQHPAATTNTTTTLLSSTSSSTLQTSSHRIPGIALFLLIFLLAIFLLLGRDRRQRIVSVFTTLGTKKRKILGSGGVVTYERVLEEGGEEEFELGGGASGGYSSDESQGRGKVGRMGSSAVLGRLGSRERVSGRSREVSPSRALGNGLGAGSARARSPLPPR